MYAKRQRVVNPHVEADGDSLCRWSSSEDCAYGYAYRSITRVVPRGHRAFGSSDGAGFKGGIGIGCIGEDNTGGIKSTFVPNRHLVEYGIAGAVIAGASAVPTTISIYKKAIRLYCGIESCTDSLCYNNVIGIPAAVGIGDVNGKGISR